MLVPKTLEECNEVLNKTLKSGDQVEFMNLPREKIITTHRTLGQWIRNNWGLWTNSPLYKHMKALGFRHPDDMSGTIIKEYWLYQNKLPSEIEADLVKYNEHWDKLGVNEEDES
jgi:hypothetical protein